jgi:hypothetical protein
MNDHDLLRRFEPVICYTQGEVFFPCAVDGYVRRCSLWLMDDKGNEQELVAAGDLTAERLAQYKEVPSRHRLYMRFVSRPLQVWDHLLWRYRPDRPSFKAPGRLARVSWYARIMDLLFNVSLLIRGSVPGGTAAAADMLNRDMHQEDPRDVYYGRVVRDERLAFRVLRRKRPRRRLGAALHLPVRRGGRRAGTILGGLRIP